MKSQGWTAYLMLVALYLNSGCSKPAEDALRVGHGGHMSSEILTIALQQQMLDATDVQPVGFPSDVYALKAFHNQLVDAAIVTLDQALVSHEVNADTRVAWVLGESLGAHALVAGPQIDNLQALRGKRIGIESELLGSWFLLRALQQAGLDVNDVTLVVVDHARQLKAYSEQEIDAVVTHEPLLTALKARDGKVLFDSSDIPGEVLYVLVAEHHTLCRKSSDFATLSKGWFDAVGHLKWQPENVQEDMVQRLGLTFPQVREAFRKIRFLSRQESEKLLIALPDNFIEDYHSVLQLMLAKNLRQQPVAPDDLLFNPGSCP